ncbi:MAG: gliding motility-associated C-terminal domain-containing protein [Bacteroidia bacterium]
MRDKLLLRLILKRKDLFLGLLVFLFFHQSFGQCGSIELVSNQNTLCQPALFKWVVKNAPAGSVYTWNYGSGAQAGQDTFYAFIQQPGKVFVTVQVKFPDNTVCNITKPNFVEVFPKPIPLFYASRKKLCDGADTVTYFDITPNSVKRSWVVDGTNYYNASKKQKHSYSSTGIKRLSLVVEDNNGCRAIKEFDTIAIIYKDVILDFTADKTSGCVVKAVEFKPNIDSNGLRLISYKWLFPGGQPLVQNKRNPDTVRYNVVGSFSPSLEVLAENGCIHSFTKQNFMAFGIIDSITLKISDTSVCKGRTIIIENLNKTLPGIFKWTLPGTTSILKPDQYTCKAKYDTMGKYNISVVYDFNGCAISKTLIKHIRVKGVKAEYTSKDYYHCLLPHNVHLTNLSKSYEPGKMIYQWMYYNNNKLVRVSNNINDSFKVKQTGQYDLVLITRHSNGCTDTFKQLNYIRNKEIMPDFDAAFRVGCIDQFIEFKQNTPPSSYKAPDKFKWTFYNNDNSKILGSSNLVAPKFSYPDTGFYTIKMVADNGIGCKDSVIKNQFIEIVNPRIAFELLNPIICKNEVLIGNGKSEPAQAKFHYFWYVKHKTDGDGFIKETENLRESIGKAGEYNFKFAHEINKGCRDSIINNDLVKINGISAQMELDTFDGCTPLMVKPVVKITENFHFGNTSDKVKYKWSASPSNNVIISNDTSRTPQFNFNLTGEYIITLEVYNSTDCKYTLNSQKIYVGVIAGIDVSDDKVCAGQEVILTNKSSLNPTKIEWLLQPGTFTNDALNKNQIKVNFKDDALHVVGLIANKLDHCYDTVYRTIQSIIVKANFKALETHMKCAPVYAQLESYSKYADSLRWDFGDGNLVTTTDPLVANIYRKNTGSLEGYNISLIAESLEGCSDTLVKEDYIKVSGPVPGFELSNHEGCEPLHVIFKNTSSDVFKHYINYDDGSPLDSTFGKYTYTIISKGLNVQDYLPRMYAIDSSGCKAEFESPVKVRVKQNSLADYTLSDSILCENQKITYVDKAVLVTSSDFYLFKTGGNTIKLTSTDVIFDTIGTYKFMQIVKNLNACEDTAKTTIVVYPNPKADFIMADTLCQLKVLNFIDKSTGAYPIAKYHWEVLNPNTPIIYDFVNIKHSFANYGPASVGLTVTDINQCRNTRLVNLMVPNPADIPPGELKVVSVNTDSSIHINSKSTNYNRFLLSNFYHTDQLDLIKTTGSNNEVIFNYYKRNILDTSVCFDLKTLDVCGYESPNGIKHCTIFLKVAGNKPFTNQLTWTPYIGWPVIDNYAVYRKKQGETNYSLLITLGSETNAYLDSGLCNLSYTYFVRANYNSLFSHSNTATNTPKFEFPPSYTDIKNVSVIDNNTIEIKWHPQSNINFFNYTLYRTNVQTYETNLIITTTNSYIDTDVNTDLYNYIYQVSEADKCGFQSKPLVEGKNIVLKTNSADYTCFANWDTYKTWTSGVKEYNLQIEKEGDFKTIYKTSNLDSAYTHDQNLENIHGPYCYRLMAVSGDEQDTSFSNISCVISPSTLFFPNAFSPNGDGINESISVKSLFVYDNTHLSGRNFTLEIFNRWGERVFLSHSVDGEWDGIYQGKMVQSGVYSYRLKAFGVDNRSYSLKGTITIIK